MESKIRISLNVPQADDPGRYFSFRLKDNIYNESVEYRLPDKVFVLSDIEGNFRSFYRLLIKCNVINKYFQWIFGDNHLIILGDCFDRGDQVTECLWLIYSLEERAKKKGGHVHFILGNHEIMNMNGDWRYVHPKYAENTKSQRAHVALYDGSNMLWKWLLTKNIIEKIGDILFVHGGISNELVRLGPSITEINRLARSYYNRANEIFTDSLLSLIYNSQHSPFWYRGYYQGQITEQQIDEILVHFGVKTIVTGHTITNQVCSYFNGKVINVNTDHGAGNSEGLLISKGKFYKISLDKKRERIMDKYWEK